MDISTSALTYAHKQLSELVQKIVSANGKPDLLSVSSEAATLGQLVARLLSTGVQPITRDILEPVARLVTLCPQLQPLREAFCKLVAIHYFLPELTTHLYLILHGPCGFSVPDWWPAVSNQDNQNALLWTTLITIDHQTAADAWLVCDVLHVAVRILNIFETLHKTEEALDKGLKDLLHIICSGNANRQLTTLLLFHDERVSEIIRDTSSGKLQDSAAMHAKMLLDVVLLTPSITIIGEAVFTLPGAGIFGRSFTSPQKKAFQIAINSPFQLVIDILNQGPKFRLLICPILRACCFIAMHEIAFGYTSRRELYSNFNTHSQTSSLVSVLTDFAFTLSRNLLYSSKDGNSVLKYFEGLFTHWDYPPFPKPNYFFAEFGEKLTTPIEEIEELKDVNDGLLLSLITIEKNLGHELEALKSDSLSKAILEKIIVCKVEHLLGSLVAALISSFKLNFGAQDREVKYSLAISLIKILLSAVDNKSLIWITLFNFTNDACYADIHLVVIFEKLFEKLVIEVDLKMGKKMFDSGASQFFQTFNDGVREYPNMVQGLNFEYPESQIVSVNEREISAVYEKKHALKGNLQIGTGNTKSSGPAYFPNSLNSSRQQSVHVDKFGK